MSKIEIKKMETVSSFKLGELCTSLELEDYANTKDMKCRVVNIGDIIKPYKFGFDGTPYFKYETFKKYYKGDHYAKIYVEVEYEPKELEISEFDFNTAEGINNYIKDLETLHHIIDIRKVAYRKKHLQLNEFVWHDFLHFDAFGQIHEIVNKVAKDNKNPNIKNLTISKDNYSSMHSKIYSLVVGADIPEANEICLECKEKWSLDNVSDYSIKRIGDYKAVGFHKDCRKKHNERTQLEEFQDIFSNIYDLKIVEFESINNEYCSCEQCKPWFIVTTPDGEIKIGWRKRVINIVWLDSYKKFNEKFKDQDVTKGFGEYNSRRFIHAWSIENAAEYLNRAKNSIIEK